MGKQVGIFVCYSCGNRTPHTELCTYAAPQLFEQIDDQVIVEQYVWVALICGTCSALSLRGGFAFSPAGKTIEVASAKRLFPSGPEIVPPPHAVSPSDPIPNAVVSAYSAAWPLRFLNPGAFANQVRRCLEFICEDQHAKGATLGAQLKDLAKRGILPPDLAEVAELLREVGNIGSHAGPKRFDVWDAELIDELFKTMVRYIYVAPAQVRRMRQRLKA